MRGLTMGWTTSVRAALAALATMAAAGEAAAQAAGQWDGPGHIYRSACIYCHETGVAPVLKGRRLPVEYVRDRVRKGFGPMPAFKPSEIDVQELEALARWLHGGEGSE